MNKTTDLAVYASAITAHISPTSQIDRPLAVTGSLSHGVHSWSLDIPAGLAAPR